MLRMETAAAAAGMGCLVLGRRWVAMGQAAHGPMGRLATPVQRDAAGIALLALPERPGQACEAGMPDVFQKPFLRCAAGAVPGEGIAVSKPTGIVPFTKTAAFMEAAAAANGAASLAFGHGG